MRRAILVLLAGLVGLMVGMSVPVMADHVTEPVLPIATLEVRSFKYPDAFLALTACDGSEVRTWDQMRHKLILGFERRHPNGTLAGQDPSEHWNAEMLVLMAFPQPNGSINYQKDWEANWGHQNRPPHFVTPSRMDIAPGTTTYNMQAKHLGLWEIRVTVTGLESGRVLSHVCQFQLAAP